MSRDPRKLRVFALADELTIEVYRISRKLPTAEKFGLQTQMRRAAISAATNIVEGCARRTTREYVNFLNIATGSAAEAQYLINVAIRLELLPKVVQTTFDRYGELLRGLQKLITSLDSDR